MQRLHERVVIVSPAYDRAIFAAINGETMNWTVEEIDNLSMLAAKLTRLLSKPELRGNAAWQSSVRITIATIAMFK
jgi:hypothetical protein